MRLFITLLTLVGHVLAMGGKDIDGESEEYDVKGYYPKAMPRPKDFIGKVYSPPFVPELFQMETPIMVYTTMRDFQLGWNCVAVMSENFLDAVTREAPLWRAPEASFNSFDRALCFTYALDIYTPWLYKTGPGTLAGMMKEWGIYDDRISEETYMDIKSCMKMRMEGKGRGCMKELAPGPDASPREVAAFAGGVVAAGMYMSMVADDWNFNGKHATPEDGVECDRPWCDYTGYAPPNNPWKLENIKGWQPLVEDNGRGFYYAQEHVTPHIYDAPPFGVPNNKEFWGRETPDPEYDLDREMELAYERVASLAGDDRRIAIAERMDNKVLVFGAILNTLTAKYSMSMETQIWVCVGYITAEHDAVVITWREKVRHSLVRPTSYSKHVVEERMVDYWTGEKVSTKMWHPFIRVMPHAEYPSGSASICTVAYEFTAALIKDQFGDDDLATTWTYKAGSNKFAKGLPKEDFVEQLDSLKDIQWQCGQSRLWGGMHFTASIEAAEKLVEGYGAEIYDYTLTLLNGNSLPSRPTEVPECGMEKMLAGVKEMSKFKPKAQRKIENACECMAACKMADFEGKPAQAFGYGPNKKGKVKTVCQCFSGFSGFADRQGVEGYISGEL